VHRSHGKPRVRSSAAAAAADLSDAYVVASNRPRVR
jgi:hypothetical protein